MKYFYCDSCFLITFCQENFLGFLSQYKENFFVSDIQINDELLKPKGIAELVRKSITVIKATEDKIERANCLMQENYGLSFYDCLCLAFCIIDGYCLVTDDKHLYKRCVRYKVNVKNTDDIKKEFIFIDFKI